MISRARSPGTINKRVDNGQIPKVAHTHTRGRADNGLRSCRIYNRISDAE